MIRTRSWYARKAHDEELEARKILHRDHGVSSWKRFKEESGWKFSAACLLRHIAAGDKAALGLVADWRSYHPQQIMLQLDGREYDL